MAYTVYVWFHHDISRYVGCTKNDGKRRGTQHFHTRKNPFKRAYFLQYRDELKLEIIANNLNERKALILEEQLIRQYGLLADGTGSLLNLTYGGAHNERSKWLREHSPCKCPETRAKMSATRLAMGDKHPMKRPELRARFSGENAVTRRPEVRAKIRASWKDPEVRARRGVQISTGQTAAWADPVRRAARLEKLRAAWERKRDP